MISFYVLIIVALFYWFYSICIYNLTVLYVIFEFYHYFFLFASLCTVYSPEHEFSGVFF
ncbi:hypothetical protein C1646_691889 [Rhizophagus diaphanus]|nr:hypothetical protein C1646_691889 [Rhizophagus diaphanus] [Rhizophagus sp. MUCL 43196]